MIKFKHGCPFCGKQSCMAGQCRGESQRLNDVFRRAAMRSSKLPDAQKSQNGTKPTPVDQQKLVAWMVIPNEKAHALQMKDVGFNEPHKREDWDVHPLFTKLTPPDGWAGAVRMAQISAAAMVAMSGPESLLAKAVLDMDAKLKQVALMPPQTEPSQ